MMERPGIKVVDTVISQEKKIVANGRRYSCVEIVYPQFSCSAGQVMLIRTSDKEVAWPYAYMIQKTTEVGFLVLAPEHSDLYRQTAGDMVVVWGPRGRSPLNKGNFLVVTEAAAYPAVLPFVLQDSGACKAAIFIDDMDSQPVLGENVHFHRADSIEAAIAATRQSRAEQILIALNPQKLLLFSKGLDEEIIKKSFAYMPTIMVCGIGGCTSCAIHNPAAEADPTLPKGILMCCEGPYQLLTKVDIASDITTFETFL